MKLKTNVARVVRFCEPTVKLTNRDLDNLIQKIEIGVPE
jgi:hypothetical protein